MKRWSPARLILTLAGSAVLWAALASICMFFGSTRIGWPSGIAFQIRLEDVLLASLVGAALASSGVVYQAILRNPLADPYLLGVSSGATLFAYLWQFPFMTGILAFLGSSGRAMGQGAAAFIGASIAIAIVLTLASRRGRLDPITLLLVGVIVNAVNGSIFLLINSIVKDPATPGGPLALLIGAIQANPPSSQKWTASISVGVGWVILLYLSGQLNVAMLSEGEAQSLGIRIHRLRWIGLIVASLVTASAVAISGPIGFIGLVCPHLARIIVGNDQRRLLPIATALGAGLLALAETTSHYVARDTMAGTVLPVGVLTGLLGGPFFLYLLWRQGQRVSES